MNEIDWLVGTSAADMLAHVEAGASDRKLRLLACACARRYWSRFSYRGSESQQAADPPRRAIELAERFAAGLATAGELEAARERAEQEAGLAAEQDRFAYLVAHAATLELAGEAARAALENAMQDARHEAAMESPFPQHDGADVRAAAEAENRAQGALIRELFGNPFRPARLPAEVLAWHGGAVVGMARVLLAEGRLDELPYLADALTDAGCPDESVIEHLRQGKHVPGCWVLDLVVGAAG